MLVLRVLCRCLSTWGRERNACFEKFPSGSEQLWIRLVPEPHQAELQTCVLSASFCRAHVTCISSVDFSYRRIWVGKRLCVKSWHSVSVHGREHPIIPTQGGKAGFTLPEQTWNLTLTPIDKSQPCYYMTILGAKCCKNPVNLGLYWVPCQ